MITSDLAVGLVLTLLAYAGLLWAVVHGKHVVDRVRKGEYPHHPNPKHRPRGADEGAPEGERSDRS